MDQTQKNIFENLTNRQIITATLVVVGVSLGFWLLYYFRLAFTLLFIAVFLGTAIRPLVDWFFSKGIPRAWGVVLVYTLLVFLVIALGFLLIPLIIEQSAELSVRLPANYQNLRAQLMISPSRLVRLIASQLPQIHNIGAPPINVDEVNPLEQVTNLMAIIGQISKGLLSVLAVEHWR